MGAVYEATALAAIRPVARNVFEQLDSLCNSMRGKVERAGPDEGREQFFHSSRDDLAFTGKGKAPCTTHGDGNGEATRDGQRKSEGRTLAQPSSTFQMPMK